MNHLDLVPPDVDYGVGGFGPTKYMRVGVLMVSYELF